MDFGCSCVSPGARDSSRPRSRRPRPPLQELGRTARAGPAPARAGPQLAPGRLPRAARRRAALPRPVPPARRAAGAPERPPRSSPKLGFRAACPRGISCPPPPPPGKLRLPNSSRFPKQKDKKCFSAATVCWPSAERAALSFSSGIPPSERAHAAPSRAYVPHKLRQSTAHGPAPAPPGEPSGSGPAPVSFRRPGAPAELLPGRPGSSPAT